MSTSVAEMLEHRFPCPEPYREPVQTIAVVSGKGGVGKSTIALNLAAALSRRDTQVMLMDGDLALGNLDRLLGIDAPRNLSHVFRGEAALGDVVVDREDGGWLIPSGSGVMEMASLSQIEHAALINLFSQLPHAADTLIVDLASGLADSVMSFSRAAREVLLVIGPGATSRQDAVATVEVLNRDCLVRRFRVVANRVESTEHGLDAYSKLVSEFGDRHDVLLDYCGSIPEDGAVQEAAESQRSVLELHPKSAAALAFGKLASRVARWPRPEVPSGRIEFFIERLIQVATDRR